MLITEHNGWHRRQALDSTGAMSYEQQVLRVGAGEYQTKTIHKTLNPDWGEFQGQDLALSVSSRLLERISPEPHPRPYEALHREMSHVHEIDMDTMHLSCVIVYDAGESSACWLPMCQPHVMSYGIPCITCRPRISSCTTWNSRSWTAGKSHGIVGYGSV